jgi:hypothetical protein
MEKQNKKNAIAIYTPNKTETLFPEPDVPQAIIRSNIRMTNEIVNITPMMEPLLKFSLKDLKNSWNRYPLSLRITFTVA